VSYQNDRLFLIILALTPHPRPALAPADLVQPGTLRVVSHTHPKPRQIRNFGFIISGSAADFNDAKQAIATIIKVPIRSAIYVLIQRKRPGIKNVPATAFKGRPGQR
jgi:hypothetical protein